MEVLFRERQRFRQVWLWVLILGIAALFVSGLVYQVIIGNEFGSRPVSDIQLVILTVLMGIGFPLFFYKMSLVTEVIPGQLRVRFWPFHLKPDKIQLHELRDFEKVTYNPIADYGGWGIRYTFHGKAYNTSGNEGVKLYFYNQKPILIGSQRADELFEAIAQAKLMS